MATKKGNCWWGLYDNNSVPILTGETKRRCQNAKKSYIVELIQSGEFDSSDKRLLQNELKIIKVPIGTKSRFGHSSSWNK